MQTLKRLKTNKVIITYQYRCGNRQSTHIHPNRNTDKIHQCYHIFVYILHYQFDIHWYLNHNSKDISHTQCITHTNTTGGIISKNISIMTRAVVATISVSTIVITSSIGESLTFVDICIGKHVYSIKNIIPLFKVKYISSVWHCNVDLYLQMQEQGPLESLFHLKSSIKSVTWKIASIRPRCFPALVIITFVF